MKNTNLKYHCPDHPERPPFCAIGDYTPCRQCYYKYRGIKIALTILFFLWMSWSSFSAGTPGQRIYRHDPNRPCREIAPDYTSHPLYGADCNELAFYIEQSTGRPWIYMFATYWMDCHPYSDPLGRCDVNFDGVTDMKDFAILSRCRIYYKTKTGTKYHVRGCSYLRSSSIVITDTKYLTPCSVCIIAPAWLSKE